MWQAKGEAVSKISLPPRALKGCALASSECRHAGYIRQAPSTQEWDCAP